jgi:hypothetical protein
VVSRVLLQKTMILARPERSRSFLQGVLAINNSVIATLKCFDGFGIVIFPDRIADCDGANPSWMYFPDNRYAPKHGKNLEICARLWNTEKSRSK